MLKEDNNHVPEEDNKHVLEDLTISKVFFQNHADNF